MSRGTKTLYLPSYLLDQFLALTSQSEIIPETRYDTRSVKPRRNTQPARAERQTYIELDTMAARTTTSSRSSTPKARRLHKPNLDGTPQTPARRLANPDFALPGDPAYIPPKTPRSAKRDAMPQRPSSTTIKQSARAAAEWLAIHFPDDAAEQGYDTFIAARYNAILSHNFEPRYWAQCTLMQNLTEVSIPQSFLDPIQQSVPPGDPARLRSKTIYGPPSEPYDNPGTGAALPQPAPGFRGTTIDGRFRDLYTAADVQEFVLARSIGASEYVPLFADCEATYHATATSRPTALQYSVKTITVLMEHSNPDHADKRNIDTEARFLKHRMPLPSDAPPNYDQTETRYYLLDCNIKASYHPDTENVVSYLRIKQAPAPARGRYFADSDDIGVDLTINQTLWQARQRDPDYAGPWPTFQAWQNTSNATFYTPPPIDQWIGWRIPNFDNTDPAIWYRYKFQTVPHQSKDYGHIVHSKAHAGPITDFLDPQNPDPRFTIVDTRRGLPTDTYHGWGYLDLDGAIYLAPGLMTEAEFRTNYVPHRPK